MSFPKFPKLSFEQIEALEAMARVDDDVIRVAMARVPPSWTLIQRLPAGGVFKCASIQVMSTVQKFEDRRIWQHVSLCGRKGHSAGPLDPAHDSSYFLPDFNDVKRVKNDFIGSDRWAYQVFPNERQYINQNKYVLHLYALLDGTPALPDFTMGIGTI